MFTLNMIKKILNTIKIISKFILALIVYILKFIQNMRENILKLYNYDERIYFLGSYHSTRWVKHTIWIWSFNFSMWVILKCIWGIISFIEYHSYLEQIVLLITYLLFGCIFWPLYGCIISGLFGFLFGSEIICYVSVICISLAYLHCILLLYVWVICDIIALDIYVIDVLSFEITIKISDFNKVYANIFNKLSK